jgi:hypothetical protein
MPVDAERKSSLNSQAIYACASTRIIYRCVHKWLIFSASISQKHNIKIIEINLARQARVALIFAIATTRTPRAELLFQRARSLSSHENKNKHVSWPIDFCCIAIHQEA